MPDEPRLNRPEPVPPLAPKVGAEAIPGIGFFEIFPFSTIS
jgi:hypothetical protein